MVVLKSGQTEFRNNRNLVDLVEWKENSDKEVVWKHFSDNGMGSRVIGHKGQKTKLLRNPNQNCEAG